MKFVPRMEAKKIIGQPMQSSAKVQGVTVFDRGVPLRLI